MIEITSLNNDLVKETVKLQQKKYRNQSGKFLIEGFKAVDEAVKYGIKVDKIFILKERQTKYHFDNQEIVLTNEMVLKKISTTDTPTDIVAIAFQPKNNIENLRKSSKVILLENVADAGNLGTIIRTAAAFNIDSIILYGDSVDLYNTKTVRAAVGNLWKMNVVKIDSIDILKKYFNDYECVATLPKMNNSIMLNDWKPSSKCLVMFGSEADGLSDKLKEMATSNLTIEMAENVESLNLAVSAALVIYKLR